MVDGLEHVYDAPGQVEFTVDGRDLALTAFPGHEPGSLTVLFTDATSGVTTYAANRALQLPPPAADGTVVLEFTRATNLPCAYTDLAPARHRRPRTGCRSRSRRGRISGPSTADPAVVRCGPALRGAVR